MTTTEDFHKDDELSEEDRKTCESGVALSVTIKRMVDTQAGVAMVVEISSHIHSNREGKAVLAALDSAHDEVESSLARRAMPEAIASLLEQLFEKFLEDTKPESDEKGKPADDE